MRAQVGIAEQVDGVHTPTGAARGGAKGARGQRDDQELGRLSQ
jgi:hypothetical protein